MNIITLIFCNFLQIQFFEKSSYQTILLAINLHGTLMHWYTSTNTPTPSAPFLNLNEGDERKNTKKAKKSFNFATVLKKRSPWWKDINISFHITQSQWVVQHILIYFSPVSHFYTPLKRQKTKGLLTFSGGIEMWHWTKMG